MKAVTTILLAILLTTGPTLAADGAIWLRAGAAAPHAGVLLSPAAAAKAEAVIAERDALRLEAAARTRATTAQAELADAWREQLVIEKERSADYLDGRSKAERGWKWQRAHGKWRWAQGIALGAVAAKLLEELR